MQKHWETSFLFFFYKCVNSLQTSSTAWQLQVVAILYVVIDWKKKIWEVSKSCTMFRLFFCLKATRKFNSVQTRLSIGVQHALLPQKKNTLWIRVRDDLRN